MTHNTDISYSSVFKQILLQNTVRLLFVKIRKNQQCCLYAYKHIFETGMPHRVQVTISKSLLV